MSKTSILLAATFLSVFSVQAQQFVNGSLEPKTPSASCNPVTSSTYNSNMNGAWINGTINTVINANGSCVVGTAAAGTNYTGLQAIDGSGPAGKYNRITLKLDAPMKAGTTYKMAFSNSIDPRSMYVQTMGMLRIGVTNDSVPTSYGGGYTFVNSIGTWKVDTIELKPTADAQYIYLQASFNGTSGTMIIYLDNFRIVSPVTSGIENMVSNSNAFGLHPNPITMKAQLNIHPSLQMPCKIAMLDIYGRVVKNETASNSTYELHRGDLPNGVYFLNVTDAQGHKYTKQVSVQ